jgi:hypothetical protein
LIFFYQLSSIVFVLYFIHLTEVLFISKSGCLFGMVNLIVLIRLDLINSIADGLNLFSFYVDFLTH